MNELRAWMERNEDSKWIIGFFFVLIMITGLYISPPDAVRWYVVGIITLFFLHIAIAWNVYWAIKGRERLHERTKLFIGICVIYWGTVGLFFPNMAEKISVNTGLAISGINEEFKPDAKSHQIANNATPPAMTKEPPLQTLYLVPGENFRSPVIPNGTRIIDNINADCPLNCIVQVDHDSDQICAENGSGDYEVDHHGKKWLLGKYQGSKCMFTIVSGGAGTIRYRERFLLKKSKVDFPTNLINVIYSFGTNPDLGPVVAKVRVATR